MSTLLYLVQILFHFCLVDSTTSLFGQVLFQFKSVWVVFIITMF